jgi:selenide,water dikinase
VLAEILRGGAERVAAAGAVIAGGHNVRDAEVKYGMAVTGVVHPARMLTNAGAQAGDVLILTKPLGSGILTSAAKNGKISPEQLNQCIEVMIDLNAGACAAALEVGVRSCTDVTGFGLIGHGHEMASASGMTLEIRAAAVPLMDHALDLARNGVVTRAWKSNLECVGSSFDAGGVDETLVKVLADAQTSGGLLVAVAADRADALVSGLRKRSTHAASVIGRVLPPSGRTITLR